MRDDDRLSVRIVDRIAEEKGRYEGREAKLPSFEKYLPLPGHRVVARSPVRAKLIEIPLLDRVRPELNDLLCLGSDEQVVEGDLLAVWINLGGVVDLFGIIIRFDQIKRQPLKTFFE